MGLPLGSLVVCTNENDVLHRFLSTGTYSNIPSHLTIAPSMDISVSSNFERYLFYLADESSDTLTSWMDIFEKTGIVSVPPHLLERARAEFKSHPSSKEDIIKAMRSVYDAENYLLCPHTATATVACRALKMPAATTVILATAHPAKFEEAVLLALEDTKMPPRPKELNALFSLPVRVSHAPSSLSHVQGFVRAKRISKGSASSWMYVAFLTLAAAVSIGFVVARNASKN
jgi:threonine synthase